MSRASRGLYSECAIPLPHLTRRNFWAKSPMNRASKLQKVKSLPAAPPRPENANKGTFGRVLIVAGSRGMSGAACLAGLGALRGGAGLVTVAVPAGILPIVGGVEPS